MPAPLGGKSRRRSLFQREVNDVKRHWWRWLVCAVLLAVLAAALDVRLAVRHYGIDAAQITSPVRLALVTDFHGCDYGEGADRLIAAIQAETPDAVLLAGDIFDDEMPWAPSEALVRVLAAQYPCYYVTGNHEYWSGRVAEIYDILASAGVRILNMEGEVLTVRGQEISLCGVPDPYAMGYEDAPDTAKQLTRAQSQAKPGTYTVLLAHRPELIDAYAAAGFDLVVSGHAHGGQVRVPLLLNGLYAPNQGLFPEYAGGHYTAEGTSLIVSRGLARESTAFPRIFNRPELVIIDLQ